MAILTDVEAAKFRQALHGDGLDLLQAESPPLNKTQLKAAFQAVEDFWEANRISLKQSMDTAAGQTISVALAKKIGKYWLQHKWGLE